MKKTSGCETSSFLRKAASVLFALCMMISLPAFFQPVEAEQPTLQTETDISADQNAQTDPATSTESEESLQTSSQSQESSEISLDADEPEDPILDEPAAAATETAAENNSANTLQYEDERIRANLSAGFDLSPYQLFVQGPWTESDSAVSDLIFTVSLMDGERIVEPPGAVHLNVLLKNTHVSENANLIHRIDKHHSESPDADIEDSSEGTSIDFQAPSLSEFVLRDPEGTAIPKVCLYDLSGRLTAEIPMSEGSSTVLPFNPLGNIPSSGRFLGWSTSSAYISNGEAWKYHPLYAPGSTLIWTEDMGNQPYRLYPVWANPGNNAWGDYFIRLDGNIPNEPTSSPAGAYTGKVPIFGAMSFIAPMVDSSGIGVGPGQPLAKEPTPEQLEAVINPKSGAIGYGAKAVDGKLYKTMNIGGLWQIVDANNQPVQYTSGKDMPPSAVSLSVLWYVMKKEGPNWHIDGVLLESSQVTLIYSIGAAGTGEVTNMPDGLALKPGTIVYAGHSLNQSSAAPSNPVRAGYEFLGWENAESGSVYQPSQTFEIDRDTVLTALWKPKSGNSFTLTKMDALSGARLGNAVFQLDSRENAQSEWKIDAALLRTQPNGTILYDGLQTGRIYRLSEMQTPAGYHPLDPFCFQILNEEGALKAILCDENGQPVEDKNGLLTVYGNNESLMLDLRAFDNPWITPLRVKKTDPQEIPLENARFSIDRMVAGTPVSQMEGTTDKDGFAVFDAGQIAQLRDGTYQLREMMPPDGHRILNPIPFFIENGKVTLPANINAALKTDGQGSYIEVKDHKGDLLPNTGSTGKLIVLAAAAGLFACAVILAVYARRKNRKGQ